MDEQISSVLRKPWVIPTIVGSVAFSGGAVAGFILGHRRGVSKMQAEAIKLLDEVHEELRSEGLVRRPKVTRHYEPIEVPIQDDIEEVRVVKEGKLHSISLVAEEPNPATGVQEITLVRDVSHDEEVVERTVTVVREVHDEIEWDWEAEKNTRTAEDPYVIHLEEFKNDEMGYTQVTITYYAGDDIMTDEQDVPIYGYLALTGELKFGHGSGDPNVVYIRNETTETEMEVIRDPRRYEVVVLGHEIDDRYKSKDLRHSAVPKFRLD